MKKIENKNEEKIYVLGEEERNEYKVEAKPFSSESVEFSSEEDLNEKNISYIEKQIRNSFEYREYINYLKNELDITQCALIPELDIKELDISLEFHHCPLNLYEITEAVSKSMIDKLEEGNSVSSFDIAEQVVKEHYCNNIGLVPLTETLHKMAHSKSILIPLEKVNGNYRNFIGTYKNFIDPEIVNRVLNNEIISNTEDNRNFIDEKLKKSIIELDVEYDEENNEQ